MSKLKRVAIFTIIAHFVCLVYFCMALDGLAMLPEVIAVCFIGMTYAFKSVPNSLVTTWAINAIWMGAYFVVSELRTAYEDVRLFFPFGPHASQLWQEIGLSIAMTGFLVFVYSIVVQIDPSRKAGSAAAGPD